MAQCVYGNRLKEGPRPPLNLHVEAGPAGAWLARGTTIINGDGAQAHNSLQAAMKTEFAAHARTLHAPHATQLPSGTLDPFAHASFPLRLNPAGSGGGGGGLTPTGKDSWRLGYW
jgi:hypothetical protein